MASVVDELQGLNVTGCTDEAVLRLLREVEVQKNRLESVDHVLVAEVEARGLAGPRACASTAVLLAQLLRITSLQARARVRAACVLGPRRSLTGQVLGPVLQDTAAAVAAGRVSARHAAVITESVDRLPVALGGELDDTVQAILLEHAEQHDPAMLAGFARDLHARLDQDGVLASDVDRRRRREVSVCQRPDGSSSLRGELDAITTESLLAVLDTLARPRPADESGQPDRRSAAQRRHDALGEAMRMLLRSDALPACGGVSASIIITLSAEQLTTRDGLATTGHGASIGVGQALSLAGDAQYQAVALDTLKQITAYSSTHRIFTQTQRLAMIARDQGCSFPGCTIPPAWCQAHHITDFALSRRTSIDDGTLLCGYHHREHPHLGWHCTMINGTPHWTPPAWQDPDQTPRRNRAHTRAPDLVPT